MGAGLANALQVLLFLYLLDDEGSNSVLVALELMFVAVAVVLVTIYEILNRLGYWPPKWLVRFKAWAAQTTCCIKLNAAWICIFGDAKETELDIVKNAENEAASERNGRVTPEGSRRPSNAGQHAESNGTAAVAVEMEMGLMKPAENGDRSSFMNYDESAPTSPVSAAGVRVELPESQRTSPATAEPGTSESPSAAVTQPLRPAVSPARAGSARKLPPALPSEISAGNDAAAGVGNERPLPPMSKTGSIRRPPPLPDSLEGQPSPAAKSGTLRGRPADLNEAAPAAAASPMSKTGTLRSKPPPLPEPVAAAAGAGAGAEGSVAVDITPVQRTGTLRRKPGNVAAAEEGAGAASMPTMSKTGSIRRPGPPPLPRSGSQKTVLDDSAAPQ